MYKCHCGLLASGDAAGPWVGDPAIGEARLVSAVTGTGDLRELPLGLEFRLAPGWKIYWRTPAKGLPPKLVQLAMVTPLPMTYTGRCQNGLMRLDLIILAMQQGYSAITLKGHPKGAAVQIIGQWNMACADICVPFTGKIGLSIVDGSATASPHAMEIARYRSKIPRNSGTSPIQVEQSGRMK